MKVAISVFGKFHLFHLARQLQERGLLSHIVSTYPRRKLTGESIPPEYLLTFPYVHLPWLALNRIGRKDDALGRDLSWLLALSLDAYAKQHLGDSDVVVGISGSGLDTGRDVQRRGGHYVCDRGSSHIRFGDELMREEFARWQVPYRRVDPRHIAREEEEYAQADAITVPSEFARRSFIASGVSADKIARVSYGADWTRFRPVAEPDPETFEVLFTGHVSLRKGVPYLLQAFSRLRHPRKRLRFVGSVQKELETLIRDGGLPTENVEFLGIVPHANLKEIMSRSHVMVLPSIEEGLALVQGEALACGCPIISSTNSGAEDIISDGREGFIIPIRAPEALLERMERLVQEPALRAEMSAAALQRVKTLGGWDEYGTQFVRVLERFGASKISDARKADPPRTGNRKEMVTG
jgi:starch synthase